MDILVLMTAAICHDLDHPGYNNTYVWDFFLGSPLKGVPSLRRNFQQFAFQQLSDGAANLDPPLPCIPSSFPTLPPALQDAVLSFWTLARALGLPWDGTSKTTKPYRRPQSLCASPGLGGAGRQQPVPSPRWRQQVYTLFSSRKLHPQAAPKGIGRVQGERGQNRKNFHVTGPRGWAQI